MLHKITFHKICSNDDYYTAYNLGRKLVECVAGAVTKGRIELGVPAKAQAIQTRTRDPSPTLAAMDVAPQDETPTIAIQLLENLIRSHNEHRLNWQLICHVEPRSTL